MAIRVLPLEGMQLHI